MRQTYDVIVIGAGAAGMMCAGLAGRRGRRVLLLDHAERLAEKIRISGGGRCNFTNLRVGAENYLSRNPHFVRSALARYGSRDFIDLVERHGIAWHEREHGQLFCDDSAQRIIDMLRAECEDGGVAWAMPLAVQRIERIAGQESADAERYLVHTAHGALACASLVIATGGLSIPKIGATPFGYKAAEQFGLPVVPPRPALVPLTLPPETLARLAPLSGASFEAEASCHGGRFREAVLITHRGLSGPAILQVSSYWQAQAYEGGERAPVTLDLLPGTDARAWLAEHAQARTLLPNLLAERLPRRFAHAWCELHGWNRPLQQFRSSELAEIADTLVAWPLAPSGTQGYAKAEVTLGGVDTRALSSRTMEAAACPGLYFVGEVTDVTGHLGGYNFQWAWSSGHAAAQVV
ncbi:BaiN/RdsA family NAD(P)/FAD-dependent oxidoreductase [Pseudothauera rhizosphaerae]|uniref:NAD(P)/FAD-dependent oxidoreductase n=1 Tax=Pseudothauera rhizosphaerae TaxID=2565932 RepID=A0A4S4AFT9_9RHOO|nr:NAD(P)/FAD-dependent oxidoreductase [Pseudothauera rhizosphaerae]THF58074.1 NAD(P)/FAD-dependent oxidoreductase [Pseudothauera rhizosphaerae]